MIYLALGLIVLGFVYASKEETRKENMRQLKGKVFNYLKTKNGR